VREQWTRLSLTTRLLITGIPVLIALVVTAINPAAGATMAVLLAGTGMATAVYVKNRTDRHNAAIDRGEIRVIGDPHFRPVARQDLPAELVERLRCLGYPVEDLQRVVRFDEGWIVRRANLREPAAVVGDDGSWARFDPRTVTDLWAVGEYRAGRGHEPTG
jgi:hypothetical protein